MSTHPHHRSLMKSAGLIGVFTALSRVLGFVRDMVIAAAFGTGLGAEAFVVSFKIPNLLRDLVGEGAANSAFVPVLTECHEKKKNEFWTLVSTLLVIMAGVLLVLSALGVFFSSQIVGLLAPGFLNSSDPQKFPLTVTLTRTIFPYIFLIGLSALAMGVLNSLKEFASSAFGPALLNLCLIIAGVFYEKKYGPMALVIGVLAGGVLQLACQIPPLLKSGFHFKKPDFHHPSVRKAGKLLIPRALGSAVYQINVFVDSILASFETIVGPGGQSALYYSNRLFQLPLAIFGVALAQAILPTFSTQMVREDLRGFKDTFAMAVRSLMFVALPASLGLAILAEPMVRIIFEHGRFDAYSTGITSSALFFYSFGLLSCCLIKILVNAFYAMHDTRTPVKTMAFSVLINIILSLILMRTLKIGGLTLASSISATMNAVLLYYFLKKRLGPLDEEKILAGFIKIMAASLVMAGFCFFYSREILSAHQDASRLSQSLYLFACVTGGIIVYGISAYCLKLEEIKKLFKR